MWISAIMFLYIWVSLLGILFVSEPEAVKMVAAVCVMPN